MTSMLTPIRVLWTVLSVAVTVPCSISFFQSSWFFHGNGRYTLGLFRYCASFGEISTCYSYSADIAVYDLATGVWQSAGLLYGGGCILMAAGSLLLVASLFKECHNLKFSAAATYAQVVAVIMWTLALVVLPLSLGAAFFKHFCGKTSTYITDECQMGWSYMLAIMGAALSYFCPVLAFFKDFNDGVYGNIRTTTSKSRHSSAASIVKRPLSAISTYDRIVSHCHALY